MIVDSNFERSSLLFACFFAPLNMGLLIAGQLTECVEYKIGSKFDDLYDMS
jgi:hypothetical protein